MRPVLASAPARAEGAKPTDVTVGSATLQIVEPESGEKELRHGTRVLVKEFSINEGLAAKFKDTSARVFNVGPGGNFCDGWPAIVTVDKDGKVAIDLTMKDLCSLYLASTDEEGFTFVEGALPARDGSVWRFTPQDGMRRLGVLVFRPQPKSTWNDLDRMLDHPLSLFNVAPFDAAVRKLTGAQFRRFRAAPGCGGGRREEGRAVPRRHRLPGACLQLGPGLHRDRSQGARGVSGDAQRYALHHMARARALAGAAARGIRGVA